MNNKTQAEYTIKLNHEQLAVLEQALNLHSRLSLGQIWSVAEFFEYQFPKLLKERDITHWDMRYEFADQWANKLFGFLPGESYGVGCPQVPESGSIAYEMQKCIQNAIADTVGMEPCTWTSKPLHYSKQPLIEVKKV